MKNRFRLYAHIILVSLLLLSCSKKRQETTEKPDTLRIITYNVWYGFTKVPDRKQQWIEWMHQQAPDVVSLQELNEYTPDMLAADAAQWGHPYSVLLKEEGFPTGITSKYPIEDIHRFMEGFHHGLLRVNIEGIYFYVIHLHPSNWETRNREVDIILKDIGSLPPDSPVVLAGDFNTFSPFDSVYYAHGRLEPFFEERDKTYGEVNLHEGRLDYSVIHKLLDSGMTDLEYAMRPGDYSFSGSFPTLIEKEGDDGDPRRLDYVFVNQILADKIIKAEIIADGQTLHLSDHLPVIAELELE